MRLNCVAIYFLPISLSVRLSSRFRHDCLTSLLFFSVEGSKNLITKREKDSWQIKVLWDSSASKVYIMFIKWRLHSFLIKAKQNGVHKNASELRYTKSIEVKWNKWAIATTLEKIHFYIGENKSGTKFRYTCDIEIKYTKCANSGTEIANTLRLKKYQWLTTAILY